MIKTGIHLALFVFAVCAPFQLKAREVFNLFPPEELAIVSQNPYDFEIDLPLSVSEIKKVPDTRVYSWPVYYKTRNTDDAEAYIAARCVPEPTHAKDGYMSGFLSGLYAKKKQFMRKITAQERFSECAQDFYYAKMKAKFYTLMMKDTFLLSELSEQNVSDLEGYYYATGNQKAYKKLEQLSQTSLPTASVASKALRTIDRADNYREP